MEFNSTFLIEKGAATEMLILITSLDVWAMRSQRSSNFQQIKLLDLYLRSIHHITLQILCSSYLCVVPL